MFVEFGTAGVETMETGLRLGSYIFSVYIDATDIVTPLYSTVKRKITSQSKFRSL